ncbi:hypothetical protein [Gordonia sihwensis]|uniref:hypothetical protein n=1 Tax=Gordonia sihwensis TaxID=173559 RepID=UPI0006990B2D|nr:hypothetical protein [Gordonia sihwensis]
MNPLDQNLWSMADDFGDAPAADSLEPIAAATMTGTIDPVMDSPAVVAPRRATATISSSADFDNGVQFGMDPDFDFVGSRAVGAAFDLPDRDEVLRSTHRTNEPRRGRSRSRREEEPPTTALAVATAETGADEAPTKKQRREERIAAAKAKRDERDFEKKAAKEAKANERAERRERKHADSSTGALAGSRPDDSRNNRRLLIGAAACAVVVAGAGIGGYMMLGGGDGQSVATPPAATSAPTSTQTPTSAVPPGSSCPSSTEGKVITGNDAGSLTASGADTIKAFNYAYYTKRSSEAAVDAVMPSSVKPMFGSVGNLQSAIDALPQGTTHCLTITDLGNGLYTTELSQIPPGGGDPEIFKQRIQTARSGGKTLIVSNQVQ